MAGANVLQFLRYGAGNTMDPVLLLLYLVVLGFIDGEEMESFFMMTIRRV